MRDGGGSAVGSGRGLRLDPFALPLAFVASDATADEGVRQVELYHERVVMRRSIAGMHMAFNMPLSAYAGVALRLMPGEDGMDATVQIILEHKDPGLRLPLFVSHEGDDAMAEWHSWSRALGLPMLVADGDGWREPYQRVGEVIVNRPRSRRRRHSAMRTRRPKMAMRRMMGKATARV